MKKTLLFTLPLLMLLLVACSGAQHGLQLSLDSDPETPGQLASIVSYKDQTRILTVISTDVCTIQCLDANGRKVEWATLSAELFRPTSTSITGAIKIHFDENTTNADRTCTIIARSEGDLICSIICLQRAKPAEEPTTEAGE